jgi:hypothetical protein
MTHTATIVSTMLLAIPVVAGAQSQPQSAPKTLAAAIGVYVFPGDGQPPDQQSIDEAECYTWAVGNTGVDPFELQKVGAAYGAAAGLVAGRRRGRQASAQAQQQVEQEAQRAQGATAEQAEGFKKAFSVCLEAKKYVVKF